LEQYDAIGDDVWSREQVCETLKKKHKDTDEI
jgi:hypothetical protein